jgi:hypothetical protein
MDARLQQTVTPIGAARSARRVEEYAGLVPSLSSLLRSTVGVAVALIETARGSGVAAGISIASRSPALECAFVDRGA